MKRSDLQQALLLIKRAQADLVDNSGVNPLYYKLEGFHEIMERYLRLFQFHLRIEDIIPNITKETLTVFDVFRLIETSIIKDTGAEGDVKLTEEQREALKNYLPSKNKRYTKNEIGNAVLIALMNEYFNADIIKRVDKFRTTYADIKLITKKSLKEIQDAILRSFLWLGYLMEFYLGLQSKGNSRLQSIFLGACRTAFWGVGYTTLILGTLLAAGMRGDFDKIAAQYGLAMYGFGALYQMMTTVLPLMYKAFGSVSKATFKYLFGSFYASADKRITVLKETEIRKIIHDLELKSESTTKKKSSAIQLPYYVAIVNS